MFPKKKFLKELKEYIPAEPVEEIIKEFRIEEKDIIKLGSNESVYGPSPKVKKVIKSNLDRINVYSSGIPIELRQAISKYCKAPVENIVVDAGIEGMLDSLGKLLIDKNDECIIPVPTFEIYEFITRIYGGIPKFVQRDENFNIPIDKLLSSVNKKTKIIFLCSPNNPTGNSLKIEEIEKILKSTDTFVVVDEAYIEFGGKSVTPTFKKYPNLIILRTLFKAFGLAAHRIDYGILPEDIVKDFNKVRLPFSINSIGVKAAIAALKDQKYLKIVVKKIKEGREFLSKNIKFKVYPSEANFVLVDVSPLKAKKVTSYLAKSGIIARDCTIFRGMGNNFIRITVGKLNQNRKIIKELNGLYWI